MSALRKWAALVVLLVVWEVLPNKGTRAEEPSPGCVPNPWAGIYPTVMTPFAPCGGIDVRSLECQLRHELAGGVHGLLVLGTFGEGQYVTPEERAEVIVTAVRVAKGKVPVVVGIHSGCLEEARAQLLQAKHLGAAAVLVKYLGNPEVNVFEFFTALSGMEALPVFYYHYPAQTGLKLGPMQIAEILALPNVVGIKESTLDLREMQSHIEVAHGLNKTVLCSTALMLTQFLHAGGHGAMCPEAVLLPDPVVQCYNAWMSGQYDEARAIQAKLFVLTPILRSGPSAPRVTRAIFTSAQDHQIPLPMSTDQPQARVKAALTYMCIPTPTCVKCPIPPLKSKDLGRVQAAVREIKQIDWYSVASRTPSIPHYSHGTTGGMLLKTGAFILGPGVGKDLLGSQGDGKAGFMN